LQTFRFMRRIVLLVILLSATFPAAAQIHEIGVFTGGSNYIGDIGAANYINPNQLAFGFVYKWNKSSRYSYRASLIFTELSGDDANSDINSRVQRDFQFKNSIRELSIGMEFNFLPFNLHNFSRPVTPYIYGGLSYFSYSDLNFNGGVVEDNGNRNTFAIPMTLGIKGKLGKHLVLGAEVGARYTFTDNLDGSNPNNANGDLSFGNIYSDDWYVFSGITLTYTFGRRPCYYCFE
jgi:hypothetical protein